MTDEDEYEEYRNTLNEIVDGGGCVETMAATSELRGEGSDTSRRDLLASDAIAGGVAESVDGVLAEVDTEDAREALRAGYDDLDDVRAAFGETVDPALFDALAAAGVDLDVDDFDLDPAVCLKTFTEADLDEAMTLLPNVSETGVVGRIVARTPVEGGTVTVHAIPEWGRSYAVVERDGTETLVLPDGTTTDAGGGAEQETGVDCDPERSARTEYVQRVVDIGGEDYVVETTCSMV
jgi:hypothetical protein